MPIDSYDELKANVQSYLKRSDLNSNIDSWIGLLEAELNNEFRVELNGWVDIEPLSDTNPTNSLLEKAPYIYLCGVLLEAARYVRNDKEIVKQQQCLLEHKQKYMAAYNVVRVVFGRR